MIRFGRKQACLWGLMLLSLAPSLAGGQTRFVTTRGKMIVSPDGKPLLLKGINLGNWLLPEGYMFKFKTTNSPRLIQTAISEMVGEDEARRFWKTYRDNYVTREDITFIKQAGTPRPADRPAITSMIVLGTLFCMKAARARD